MLPKPIKHSVILNYLQRFSTQIQTPLKALTQNEEPETAQHDANKNIYADARLLLVEDNQVNQKVALAMLKKLGYSQVDHAFNGEEALKMIKASIYDLILMDCQMPVIDGYETTRRIRQLENEQYQALPVLALTAHTMKGDDEKCYQAGMNDYLSKPVRIDELAKKLNKWLSSRMKVMLM